MAGFFEPNCCQRDSNSMLRRTFQLFQNKMLVQSYCIFCKPQVCGQKLDLAAYITKKSKNRYANHDLLLLAIRFHCMSKNTDVQTHWADISSAVEIARSKVVAKREISITKKFLKNRQTLQIVGGMVFEKYLKRVTSLH